MTPSKNPSRSGNGILFLLSICCASACLFAVGGSRTFGNALPGDQHWDNQFGFVGTSDHLYAVNAMGGKLFVGGFLTAAGNATANYVAGYDGTNWFQLNNGVSGIFNDTYIWALANDGTNLYVGGLFTNADDSGAINIARWDGSTWHPLAGGAPNSLVTSIKIAGTNFFAAGLFTSIGTTSANCVAQWTGQTWKPLSSGLSGGTSFVTEALALEYDGTYLYAGGNFTKAGSGSAINIARWDGSSWSAMGSGLPGQVLAICSLNGYLYAGGSFTNASLSITNFARWNGSTWSAVGSGPDGAVQALATDGTNLYVGGIFTHINGIAANRAAIWDGSNWHALGTGIQGFGEGTSLGVYNITLDSQGRMFAAGNFNQAGGLGASHVAGWNGASWFALGPTTSKGMTHTLGVVQGLTSDGTNIYAGGTFTEGGSKIADQVARWDGTNWWPVGVATAGTLPEAGPIALALGGGYLFAGGNFTNIGPYTITYVGYWDGTSWNSAGAAGQVNALAYDGTNMWVGGAFISVLGVFSPGLALYKVGSGWSSVGEAAGGGKTVNAIARSGSAMYVGGSFTGIDSVHGLVNATNIAVFNWSTTTWGSLGNGLNGTVNAILVTNGFVYVGGSFTSAGGVAANGIAEWNGSAWSALGSGVTNSSGAGTVNALAMIGNTLYAGGTFTNAGGTYASGLAAWDGSTWSGLGSGLYSSAFGGQAGYANALVALGNGLYVGGNFTSAGNKPADFFAHWNDELDYYPPPHPFLTRTARLPGNQFQFRLAGTSGENYIIQGSTNFVQWTSLFTNSATLYDYTDPSASQFPMRFYRALLAP